MKTATGNLWTYYDDGYLIVIPTNGTVTKNGEAVMGRGVALQAVQRFPILSNILGLSLSKYGNNVYFNSNRLITFPVKHNWWEKADINLLQRSAEQLQMEEEYSTEVYLPLVGCGNGKLHKEQVLPILKSILDDRFTLVCMEIQLANNR